MGSCMCFEFAVNDLIETLQEIGSSWIDVNCGQYMNIELVRVIEYQIDCVT